MAIWPAVAGARGDAVVLVSVSVAVGLLLGERVTRIVFADVTTPGDFRSYWARKWHDQVSLNSFSERCGGLGTKELAQAVVGWRTRAQRDGHRYQGADEEHDRGRHDAAIRAQPVNQVVAVLAET